MRLSMVLIARNERHNVRDCLSSFADHVDEIVFVDTGSRDGTVAEVRRVCREHGWMDRLVIGRFRWRQDFGKARTFAHSQATGDVHCYLDLDERVVGVEFLRDEAQRLIDDPTLDVISAIWSGSLNPEQWQPRLFRSPVTWTGPTWEMPLERGRSWMTNRVRFHHTRDTPRGRRDLKIAARWARDEPDNWRPFHALASEGTDLGLWDMVLDVAGRGLALPDVPPEIRSFLAVRCAKAHRELGERGRAEEMARAAIVCLDGEGFDWSGSLCSAHLILVDSALERRAPADALECARSALRSAPTDELRNDAVAAMQLAQMRLTDEAVTRMVRGLNPSALMTMATDVFGGRA